MHCAHRQQVQRLLHLPLHWVQGGFPCLAALLLLTVKSSQTVMYLRGQATLYYQDIETMQSLATVGTHVFALIWICSSIEAKKIKNGSAGLLPLQPAVLPIFRRKGIWQFALVFTQVWHALQHDIF